MDYSTGLSAIPLDVEKKLNTALLTRLKKDGHGISFPDRTGCQVRFQRGQEIISRFYAYAEYGGIRKALTAAIDYVCTLRLLAEHKNIPRSGTGGVTYIERRSSRCPDRLEYCYSVYYYKPDGKRSTKWFYIGTGERPSPDKQLHAFRTAKLFRHHYELYGPTLDVAWFKPWKYTRLYTPDREYFPWASA